MSNPFLYCIDFCFAPNNKGNPDGEGHYSLGFGFIKRTSESSAWVKVDGFTEQMVKNNDFGFRLYDLSQTVSQIDYVTIDMRPAGDSSDPKHTSPFSDSDEDKLRKGTSLTAAGTLASRGCGSSTYAPTGNYFDAGTYALKNIGDYEMTVEMRIAVNGQPVTFKCDPKMQVGSEG